MKQQLGITVGQLGRSAAVNVTAFALYWLVGFALVQLGRLITGAPHSDHVLVFVGTIVGVGIALVLGARCTTYLLAGLVAFTGSKLVVLAFYGWNSVQGLEPNFAIMGAGLIGVCLGALLATWPFQSRSRESHAV